MSRLLKLLLAAAFFNALAWIILIPVWQYPDEQAHFAQVQTITEHGSLPRLGPNTSSEIAISERILGTERDDFGNNKFTYHPEYRIEYSKDLDGENEFELLNLQKSARSQLVKNEATANPPLYYLLSAGVYKIFYDTSLLERVFAVRMLSSIFYILVIFFAFKTGSLIFEEKITAIALAALVAFMPMFVFSSTGVLPDPLTNLLFAIIIFLSVKFLTEGPKGKTIVQTVIVFLLGVLTRQHFTIALPIIATALFFRFYKTRNLKILSIFALGVTLILFLSGKFLTSYPLISNFRIPDEGIISLKLLFSSALLDHTIWTLKHTYSEVLPWYWGVYKWLSLTLPPIYYQIINRILAVSLLGFALYLFLVFKSKKVTKENLIVIFMVVALSIYFLAFLVWDYFFRAKNTFSFGIQGRYFFPLISAQMLLLTVGIRQLMMFFFAKYEKFAILLLVLLMIIANDFSLAFVASSYYEMKDFGTFITQASQYKPIALKGNIILFILSFALLAQLIFLTSYAKDIIIKK